MKPFYSFTFFAKAALLFSACASNAPEDDFRHMITQARQYPIIKDTEVYLSTPFMVAEFKKLKLDEQAYVILDESPRKRGEGLRPYIRFTEKARPFIIGDTYISGEGFTALTQRVACCNIDFKGISRIRFNGDKTKAIVLYEEVYKNVSPFANLYAENPRQEIREGGTLLHEVYFSREEEGWKVEISPDTAFMAAFVAF